MENLHLKNLDLSKVHDQIEKNKLKSILEINKQIIELIKDDEDSNTEYDKKEQTDFLNLKRYFI